MKVSGLAFIGAIGRPGGAWRPQTVWSSPALQAGPLPSQGQGGRHGLQEAFPTPRLPSGALRPFRAFQKHPVNYMKTQFAHKDEAESLGTVADRLSARWRIKGGLAEDRQDPSTSNTQQERKEGARLPEDRVVGLRPQAAQAGPRHPCVPCAHRPQPSNTRMNSRPPLRAREMA